MGQDNMNIESLCLQNNCEFVTKQIRHNLTNKFQTFGTSINQKAKRFFSSRINRWCTESQPTNGKSPGDVKVCFKLSNLKHLDTKWVVEMYHYLK